MNADLGVEVYRDDGLVRVGVLHINLVDGVLQCAQGLAHQCARLHALWVEVVGFEAEREVIEELWDVLQLVVGRFSES